jgi:hypothetical protein
MNLSVRSCFPEKVDPAGTVRRFARFTGVPRCGGGNMPRYLAHITTDERLLAARKRSIEVLARMQAFTEFSEKLML